MNSYERMFESCKQNICVLGCFFVSATSAYNHSFYLFLFWSKSSLPFKTISLQSLHYAMTKVPLMWWKWSNLESQQHREAGDIYRVNTLCLQEQCCLERQQLQEGHPRCLICFIPSAVWIQLPPGSPSVCSWDLGEIKFLSPFSTCLAHGNAYTMKY